MYGYKYIEGELLRSVWPSFSEQEKIDICTALGKFHSEIGKKFTKEMSKASGIRINESLGWHPEIVKAYDRYTADNSIPSEYRELVKKARGIYDATLDKAFFQFIHNDAHHENIIVKDKKISGVIDFGDSEYGEIAKEFSRYIRDFPEHFQYIVDSYIKESGNTLSYPHLISNAFISGFAEIVEDYQKGGKGREKAQKTIDTYKRLLMIK
jgi:Ser/Thr protein kinase RdoA (MazF antagonist)